MTRLPVGIYASPTRIRCVGCGLMAIGQTESLCVQCASDPYELLSDAEGMLVAYRAHADQCWTALRTATEQADDRVSQRWQRFMDARTEDAAKHAQAIAQARGGSVGPLSDLIRLYVAWVDAQGVYDERKAWAERVEAAIGELGVCTST